MRRWLAGFGLLSLLLGSGCDGGLNRPYAESPAGSALFAAAERDGRAQAEREWEDGIAGPPLSGLTRIEHGGIDPKSGLTYWRWSGCLMSPTSEGFEQGYQDRLGELIARDGRPSSQRYARVIDLLSSAPVWGNAKSGGSLTCGVWVPGAPEVRTPTTTIQRDAGLQPVAGGDGLQIAIQSAATGSTLILQCGPEHAEFTVPNRTITAVQATVDAERSRLGWLLLKMEDRDPHLVSWTNAHPRSADDSPRTFVPVWSNWVFDLDRLRVLRRW